ncbi:MAG: hypothetical protein KTR17_04120, partial [Cellvibrionaceae bacterium]|nr:hypothetical protein [Cellvibrionaceae bacterium]
MFRSRIQTLLPIIISIALIIFFLRFATLYLLGSYVFQSVEPKQPEHRVIKLLGANIHYLEKTAAAAPIVLLHG